jgi:hypothetical protein
MGSKHLLTPFISYNKFFIKFGALRVLFNLITITRKDAKKYQRFLGPILKI